MVWNSMARNHASHYYITLTIDRKRRKGRRPEWRSALYAADILPADAIWGPFYHLRVYIHQCECEYSVNGSAKSGAVLKPYLGIVAFCYGGGDIGIFGHPLPTTTPAQPCQCAIV